MPKKFKGENSKAVVARARKVAVQQEVLERKQKAIEDEYWRDEDKHVLRKQSRKEEKEKKKVDLLERKHENQRMLEDEDSSLKSFKVTTPAKLTRTDITERQLLAAAAAMKTPVEPLHHELPLEENMNKMIIEGGARDVDEAIAVLSVRDPATAAEDRHPERRMRAAYTAFEAVRMPALKAENANMRLSQLKQLLKKEWQRSSQNPMNQRQAAYNASQKQ